MKAGLGLNNLLGDVKAEFRIGEPVVNEGGGGMSPEVGGRLDGGTGAVGIMGKGGMLVVDVGGVRPWLISKNFLAFLTASSEEESDLFLFLGVADDGSDAEPGLGVGNFLLLSEFEAVEAAEARFLAFFLVVEGVGVVPDPGVGNASDPLTIIHFLARI